MNRKSLEKQLEKLGYRLRETWDPDSRWMVSSTLTDFHWSFKTLEGVRLFTLDEKNLVKYARAVIGK